eukprot:3094410-Prymnesium_polylepis.1
MPWLRKATLSLAICNFLVACAQPLSCDSDTSAGAEQQHDSGAPPPCWPQAVSVLRGRDAVEQVLRAMQNEEARGDPRWPIPLERILACP